MTTDADVRRFLALLAGENRCLAAGNAQAAAMLLPEKEQAAATLVAAMKITRPAPELLADLKLATEENVRHLRLALSVQSRILEMVARASVASAPAGAYGRPGGRGGHGASRSGAIALAMRA